MGIKSWQLFLMVYTPQNGFKHAIQLARMGVKYTQPKIEKIKKGSEEYG